MTLKLFQLVSIFLAALVAGVFWGPWIALSRSMAAFSPEVFLAITHRMNKNLGPVMTVLMPAALLSIVPVLFLTYKTQPVDFYLALTALVLFIVALLVTVLVEVPLVQQFASWTATTLPTNWPSLRDRWISFHIVRVVAGLAGLMLLVAAAIF